jgi:hypothetical protein
MSTIVLEDALQKMFSFPSLLRSGQGRVRMRLGASYTLSIPFHEHNVVGQNKHETV